MENEQKPNSSSKQALVVIGLIVLFAVAFGIGKSGRRTPPPAAPSYDVGTAQEWTSACQYGAYRPLRIGVVAGGGNGDVFCECFGYNVSEFDALMGAGVSDTEFSRAVDRITGSCIAQSLGY